MPYSERLFQAERKEKAMQKNEAQEKLINTIYGPVICIACPGSGKTTTLLRRISHMIETGIRPDEIMMITFTKAAAEEMAGRFRKMTGGNSDVTFCTIHRLCLDILRKYKGFDSSMIASNSADIVYDLVREIPSVNDPDQFVKDLLLDISAVKNDMTVPEKHKQRCCDDNRLFSKIYREYQKRLEYEGKIDFDDILLKAYEALRDDYILTSVRDRFGFIHVDEYQDTNFLQNDIVRMIAGSAANLTVVGDDDQSIYAFRGAKPDVMLSFKKYYPNATEIYMSTNYRSYSNIIRSADRMIRNNTKRYPKEIEPFNKTPGTVSVRYDESRGEEFAHVISDIKEQKGKGVSYNDMAILFRTNSQQMLIGDALTEEGIPFRTFDTPENRYDHWIFTDILAYYAVSHMTKKKEELGAEFMATVTHPMRYIHHADFRKTGLDREKLLKSAVDPNLESWKNDNTVESVNEYCSLMNYLKTLDRPLRFMNALYNTGKYREYLADYAEYRKIRLSDLEYIWKSYIRDIKKHDLNTFDAWNRYAAKFRLMSGDKNDNEAEGVSLATMHASKGLEWDSVMIIDCIEGTVPFAKDGECDIEEERRLFYVAVTRAKKDLYLYAYDKGEPSRFIAEMQLEKNIS